MQQILPVTFPFFALVLCGHLAARWRWLPLGAIPGLNAFVLFFALPCMLYRFAAGTPIVRLLDPAVSAVYLLCALATVALAVAATRRGLPGWNDTAFGALVAAFPNSGFMGVPLVVALLGERAAGPAIVTLIVDLVVTSSVCIGLSRLDHANGLGAGAATRRALVGMLTNPLPWAIALGCLSAATGFQLWLPLARTAEMLGNGASPVALFTIGAVLARPQAPSTAARRVGDVPLVVFCKLVLHPALVWGVGQLALRGGVALDRFSLTVLVLVAALPSASSVPMLAERFGADAARIARIVLVATALSFVSFSAVVALLA